MSHLALRMNYLHANVMPDRSMGEPQDNMKELRNPKRDLHRRDLLKGVAADLLRKHGGKMGAKLKAEGK
jgi:hypothetical protein